MKRLLVFLPALLVLVFIITACGTNTPTTTTPASTTPTATVPTATTATTAPPSTSATIKPSTPPTASASPASTATPQYGGTLRYARTDSAGAVFGTPWLLSGPANYTNQIGFQTLISERVGSSDMSMLASSFDVVTDPANASITFHLRKGIKFQDGTDFNANAVQWNLQKQMGSNSVNTSTTNNFKSVDVIDDYTVKVPLKTWQNTLITAFANNMSYMASPTAFDKNGASWMNTHMVGTGAFTQTDYQQDVSWTGVKNTNYWEAGKPYVDKVQMVYVADDLTRLALFKSGGCDILSNGSNALLASTLISQGYKSLVLSLGNIALWPDSDNADSPWSNIKVRQAAEYAIDKEALAKTLGYGLMHSLYQFHNDQSVAYDPNLPKRTYDVAKAKQLLSDAGYANGFKTTIIQSAMVTDRNAAVAIQGYLAKVGIQCDIQYPTTAAYNAIYTGGGRWHNAIIYTIINGWANPSQALNSYMNANKLTFGSTQRPPGFQDLLTAAINSPQVDPALCKKMENALYDHETVIPVTDQIAQWSIADNLRDSGVATFFTNSFWTPQNAWFQK